MIKRYTGFLLLLVSLFQLTEAKEECKQNIVFSFDDRDWEVGYEASNDETAMVEFVLKGENVENWKELVTVQKVSFTQGSLDDYYKVFLKLLKESVAPALVNSKLIRKTSDTVFFEWWISGQGPQTQHEWMKIFKIDGGAISLRYTTKNVDQVEKVRKVWEKNIDESKYVQEGDCQKKDTKEVTQRFNHVK